jgi:hypothetical protein
MCSKVDEQSDIRGVEESSPKGYLLFTKRKALDDPGIEPPTHPVMRHPKPLRHIMTYSERDCCGIYT